MVKYLQIDSVDDNLKTPSFSFTEVVIDFTPYQPSTGAKYYLDFRDASNTTHYFYSNNTNDTYNGFTSFFVNGVSKGNNVSSVPRSSRSTVRLVSSAAITRVGTIGARYLNDLRMQMDIYNIKFYNGTTLVAHYDMTTGTVQDQSGNGYHATLTGGTWLDDGTGGGNTPTTQDGASTLVGTGNLSATGNTVKQGASTFVGTGVLTATGSVIANVTVRDGAVNLLGTGNITAVGVTIKEGQASTLGQGVLLADGDVISVPREPQTIDGDFQAKGTGVLVANGDIIRAIRNTKELSLTFEIDRTYVTHHEINRAISLHSDYERSLTLTFDV